MEIAPFQGEVGGQQSPHSAVYVYVHDAHRHAMPLIEGTGTDVISEPVSSMQTNGQRGQRMKMCVAEGSAQDTGLLVGVTRESTSQHLLECAFQQTQFKRCLPTS